MTGSNILPGDVNPHVVTHYLQDIAHGVEYILDFDRILYNSVLKV